MCREAAVFTGYKVSTRSKEGRQASKLNISNIKQKTERCGKHECKNVRGVFWTKLGVAIVIKHSPDLAKTNGSKRKFHVISKQVMVRDFALSIIMILRNESKTFAILTAIIQLIRVFSPSTQKHLSSFSSRALKGYREKHRRNKAFE